MDFPHGFAVNHRLSPEFTFPPQKSSRVVLNLQIYPKDQNFSMNELSNTHFSYSFSSQIGLYKLANLIFQVEKENLKERYESRTQKKSRSTLVVAG
jgi:hypothetical protein